MWSATSKPTVSFTCVECYKQALTVSSVSFTWVEYYRQTFTVKFCQFYLCGVLQASPQSVLPVWSATSKPTVSFTCVECYKQAHSQFYLCGVLQASPHRKFCQFYLGGVLQANLDCKVLSVLPVWSATSKPTVSFTCVECYKQAHSQFYLCGVLQASPHRKFCQFYLGGVLQANLDCKVLSVLPVWSATSKPTVSFTCVECYKQAHSQFYLCGVLQASPHRKFCQFYLGGVLQANLYCKVLSVLPVWSAAS